LGTVVEGLPLMATLLTLIGELVHFDIFLRAAAYEQIKKIADARGVNFFLSL
jgi:signal recognition particle GTPase